MDTVHAMLALLLVFSAFVSYLMTQMSIGFSLHHGLLDVPNPRSSHSGLVPRVGGIGILGGFYVVLGALCVANFLGFVVASVEAQYALLVAVVGGGMALTGLYDDLRGLRPSTKLLLQVAWALVIIAAGMRLVSVSLPFLPPATLGVLSLPLTVLWLAGFSNIYNFMDGIDGLAGGTGIAYGSFLFLFAAMVGSQGGAIVALLLVGSCLGFLFHNLAPARTFMGDVGSLFLGLVFALLVVQIAQQAARPEALTALLLLCSLFLYDSGFTLLRRLRRRENIFRAHRSHLYQRLVLAGFTHGKVCALYVGLHVLVGSLGLAYMEASELVRLGILGLTAAVFLTLTVAVGWVERQQLSRSLRGSKQDA